MPSADAAPSAPLLALCTDRGRGHRPASTSRHRPCCVCPASCQTRQAVCSPSPSATLSPSTQASESHESQAPPSFVLQGQAGQAEGVPHGGQEGLHGEAYGMGVGHRRTGLVPQTRTRTMTAVESEDPNGREAATPSTITWLAGRRGAGSRLWAQPGDGRVSGTGASVWTAGKGDLQGVPADSCSEEKD